MVTLKMPDINCVMIAGNLTHEPSFRKTTNGTPVANFCIASNRKFKDNSGQWRENVCFIGVVAWHKLAESCCDFLAKGSAVLVEGELQSRCWRNEDGTNNNIVEIKARRIQFLNKQKKEDQRNGDEESEELTTSPLEDSPELKVANDNADGPIPKEVEMRPGSSDHSTFNFGFDEANFR